MGIRKKPILTSYGLLYPASNSDSLLVMVHGFNFKGDKDPARSYEYWGRVGQYLLDEPRVEHSDILFFHYPSSSSLVPRFEARLRGGPPCANLEAVENSLISALRFFSKEKSGEIDVLAHSLGAHVALRAVSGFLQGDKDNHVRSINLIAAPNKPHPTAITHNFLSLGLNPQTRFLSSRNKLYANLVDRLAEIEHLGELRPKKTRVGHIYSIDDPFVDYEPSLIFDNVETINQSHTWFENVSTPLSPEYKMLVNFSFEMTND